MTEDYNFKLQLGASAVQQLIEAARDYQRAVSETDGSEAVLARTKVKLDTHANRLLELLAPTPPVKTVDPLTVRADIDRPVERWEMEFARGIVWGVALGGTSEQRNLISDVSKLMQRLFHRQRED